MNKFFSIITIAFLLAIGATLVQGQTFSMYDKIFIGPTLGYDYYFAGGTLGFGARGEYGLMDNVEVGSFKGAIGVGAELSYTSYKESGYGWEWSYTLVNFLVFGSYHFKPHNDFDPYVRLGLGYNHISSSVSTPYGNLYGSSASYGSGIGLDGSIGFDYHLSDNMKFRADLGWPFLFAVGIDFSLGKMDWQKK